MLAISSFNYAFSVRRRLVSVSSLLWPRLSFLSWSIQMVFNFLFLDRSFVSSSMLIGGGAALIVAFNSSIWDFNMSSSYRSLPDSSLASLLSSSLYFSNSTTFSNLSWEKLNSISVSSSKFQYVIKSSNKSLSFVFCSTSLWCVYFKSWYSVSSCVNFSFISLYFLSRAFMV